MVGYKVAGNMRSEEFKPRPDFPPLLPSRACLELNPCTEPAGIPSWRCGCGQAQVPSMSEGDHGRLASSLAVVHEDTPSIDGERQPLPAWLGFIAVGCRSGMCRGLAREESFRDLFLLARPP